MEDWRIEISRMIYEGMREGQSEVRRGRKKENKNGRWNYKYS